MQMRQITKVDAQHNFDNVINADTSDQVVFCFQVFFISLMDSLSNLTAELKHGVCQPHTKKKKIMVSSFSTKCLGSLKCVHAASENMIDEDSTSEATK